MTKQKSTILKIVLAVCIIGGAVVILGRNTSERTVERELAVSDNKSSEMYTWEEYQELSLEEQDAFYEHFESAEDFTVWMNAAKPDEEIAPDLNWNKRGKQPDAYTWEEYQVLSAEDRDAFFHWFASQEEFNDWKNTVKPVESIVVTKWDNSEKCPGEYTWEEFQALNSNKQEAFYQWFESTEDFEIWMESVKPEENLVPVIQWNKPGKQPNEYTWEEFQKLSLEEQDAFFLWFDSMTAFETWMEQVKSDENESAVMKWDKPGKQPNEYTWEEFQALSPEEQEAFFLWFESLEDFEEWREIYEPKRYS